MKSRQIDAGGRLSAPTARDVYRTSTTKFRRRRLDRRTVGIAACAAVFLLVISASLFFIFTGRSNVTDRRAEIESNISAGYISDTEQ